MMLGGEEEEVRSECSSGCQSGWTMYLDQSSSSQEVSGSLVYKKGSSFLQEEEEEEEEEDLSMVSDASSGPPHFQGGDQHYNSWQGSWSLSSAMAPAAAFTIEGGKKRRVASGRLVESSFILDDTASSPLFNSCSQSKFNGDMNKTSMEGDGALEFSCGFSATHFKGKSALQKQMGYLSSNVPVKSNPTRPVSKSESRRKKR